MAEYLSTLTGVQHANPDGTDRQTLIGQCQLGERLVLVLDSNNERSEHAVAVCRAGGGPIGYLPDDVAERVFAHLRSGRAAWAEVKELTGGTREWPRRGVNVVVHLEEGRAARSAAAAAGRGCLSAVLLAALAAALTATFAALT
jgi:hypothetical protein